MKRKLLIFLLVTCTSLAWAQQYPMRNYNMHDGLSHSNIYRIFQDKKGFLWFCTDYGLCSFDGKVFHSYLSPNDSLLANSILSISEDNEGNKYISTLKNGIVIFSDSGLSRYPYPDSTPITRALYAVKKNDIVWAIFQIDKQYLYKIKKGTFTQFDIRNDTGGKVAFNKVCLEKNDVFFCSKNGIYKIEDSTLHPFLNTIIKGNVYDIKIDKNGNYWVITDNKVISVKDNKIVEEYSFGKGQVPGGILCDKHNNVWVSLQGEGMLLINNKVIKDISNRLTIHKTIINDMFEDSEGNIWIATYDGGLFMMSTLDIVKYPVSQNNLNIYCHSLDPYGKNKIVIGTIGKISIWENEMIKPVNIKNLRYDQFIYFAKYLDDHIYIGTPTTLIRKQVVPPYKEEIIQGKSTNATIGSISFYKDKRGKIWLGNFVGLFYLDNNKIIWDSTATALNNKRINTILEDKNGNFWYGTSTGLIKFDGTTYINPFTTASKSLNSINEILEDSHGRIWIATEGGLICIENGKCIIFKKENGLTHNKCNRLVENNNTLWIGTLNGLSFINLNSLEIKAYGAGIYPDEVLSLYCNDSNTLFVGTANGLSSIKTNYINIDNTAPPTYITSIKTSKSETAMPKEIKLLYADTKLTINFIGISFQHANTVEYRYKIENLDDNWHTTTNTSIELPSLPSGAYTFVLNARKNKGAWSKDIRLPIMVSTPLWKNWWFISLTLLVIAVCIFYVTRQQIIRQELKKRQQLSIYNKVAYLKQQALSALINPHFIFNCMNSIQHYLNKKDNDLANSYLADFAHLIRMTMENAQEAFINLDKEIVRIKLYLSLEQLRFGGDLHYEINVGKDLDTNSIRIPNMILQPYIENAIWHGVMPNNAAGIIQVSFQKESENEIKITVTDNGIGIENSKKKQASTNSSHYGMSLTAERLHLLKQLTNQQYTISVTEMTDDTGNCKGTIVSIIVPVLPGEAALDQLEEQLVS